MTGPEAIIRRLPLPPQSLLFATGAVLTAVATVVVAGKKPDLALAMIVAMPLGMILLAWPNSATVLVFFVLYTNAAVIAVKFHGVPFVVGAALPALLLVPLAYYLVICRQKIITPPALGLVFCFVGVQCFAALFSNNPAVSFDVLLTTLVEGCGLYILVTNVIRSKSTLRLVIWAILAAGAFLGALGVTQQATNSFTKNYGGFAQVSNTGFKTGIAANHGEVRQRRLAGALGEQNFHAQLMLMLVPLGMFRFWSERSNLLRLVAAGMTALIVAGLALTFSRGAAVALVLMIAMMGFLRYIAWYQFGLVVAAMLVLLTALPQYATRLTSLTALHDALTVDEIGLAGADRSMRSRFTESMAAALMFWDYPLTGVGPGMYPYHYAEYARKASGEVQESNRQAHILYLGLAAETGAPGLLLFLAIVAVTMRSLVDARRRCLRSHPEMANMLTGFMFAIITYLTTGLFLHFAYVRYFWLMIALSASACLVARRVLTASASSDSLPDAADTSENGRATVPGRLYHVLQCSTRTERSFPTAKERAYATS